METQNCWIITEGIAGTENQCIAVAEALQLPFTIKKVGLKFPFDRLSPHIFQTTPRWAITGLDWDEPFPDMIIASGRKAVPVALQFKNTFKVFIQDPKINPRHFDLVAAPYHDELSGDNVIVTVAAPNRVTPALLSEAKHKFDFSYLPDKKIAIMIGGNSKSHTMNNNFAHALFEQLMPYIRSNEYGIMMTVSRRTPENTYNDLKGLFDFPNIYFWNGEGDNPYHAFLAYADFVLVTEDSTSMLSDACTSGKTVYRIPLTGGSRKFDILYQRLKSRCMVFPFKGELKHQNYKPLNDARMIADKIRKSFANYTSKT
jgi:mitochondrial fission protein ELM1